MENKNIRLVDPVTPLSIRSHDDDDDDDSHSFLNLQTDFHRYEISIVQLEGSACFRNTTDRNSTDQARWEEICIAKESLNHLLEYSNSH